MNAHNQFMTNGHQLGEPAAAAASLVDQVRALVDEALTTGRRIPGRPAMARALNTSEHRVRLALQALREESRRRAANKQKSSTDLAPVSEQAHQSGESRDSPEVATHDRTSAGGGRDASRNRAPRPWPLVLIGLAAAVSVWSGWVGLGQMAGFGIVKPLPGLIDGLEVNSAIVLPISVEAYAAYALRCWLTTDAISRTARRFAMASAIASLVIGALAQVAYHLMAAAGVTVAPWPVIVGVASVPVMVLGLAAALANLVAVKHHICH
ncbi:hypothetical protein [Actinokineospora sp. HUAS TT18]|uniref:hypothetical protein n=1 Tax=Actinokineospora sp. HUAS TT18 TaxID=3447451 RepID=UPI003F5237DE